eukprot:m.1271083 g.1271083  ORF g.1271083 m.1271083 type:complete len:77 (+) comp24750_c0_seq12:178-408(+)
MLVIYKVIILRAQPSDTIPFTHVSAHVAETKPLNFRSVRHPHGHEKSTSACKQIARSAQHIHRGRTECREYLAPGS